MIIAAKASSMKPSKKLIQSAQQEQSADMELTAARTASGRKRRPTERETYRFSKTHEGEDRHKGLEMKMEKRKLKVLRAAYQKNPAEFDDEPAELHSDIDRDEENMFSDRLVPTKVSKPQALAYSASKTPPVVSAPKSISNAGRSFSMNKSLPATISASKSISNLHKASATVATNSDSASASASDNSESENQCEIIDNDVHSVHSADYISEHHDQLDEDASPQVVGTKRQLQGVVEETKPKLMKTSNGSRHRLKASDFDEVTKDLLAIATSIYCCLIVTREPFPLTLVIEMKLAREAWCEASNLAHLAVRLTPSLVKMMTRHTSHVRGELKTKMRALTASFFGFRTSHSTVAIKQNRDLAESLKDGSCFAFKDWETKCGIYKTELIQSAINNMWFANRSDEGVIHGRYFNPLPVELLALILTAIECCIDEWLTGVKEDIKFSSAAYAPVYQVHLTSLRRFDERTSAYKLLEKICDNVLDVARLHAGVHLAQPGLATPVSFADTVFEDAIREYEAETRDAQEGGLEGQEE
ncbi:hypothetical protein F4604DRAFT_1931188 [Suillus subluteus]|nr:hypothetical protein F4604DRAFT_1931188 [Suillus subluteus]